MANEAHLEIIKQGVNVWNEWREKNPVTIPYLVDIDLSAAPLATVNLSNSILNNSNFSYADLGSANFENARLIGANLTGARLSGARFNNAELRDARLSKTILVSAELQNANLRSTNLFLSNLSYAKLDRAKLHFANLESTILSGASLTNTDFTNALIAWVTFGNTDLSSAVGLETIFHRAPSSIGIDTIYLSKGSVPESFLRGAGVPDSFITYARTLIGKAIDFNSCFISFTESDDLFSQRVYNDLQGAGVRCWRWKEDAQWGKSLMRSIDGAVRIYDKLVVVCSEHSLNSPAVIREIERALQKEDQLIKREQEGEVLFPIRIDDYVFTGWEHYRKPDVLAKNVGDFRQWKEPESYRKSFERLLRDLRSRCASEGRA